MNFGIFLLFSRPDWLSDEEALGREVEYARLADALGYDCVWLAEHHFVPYGLCGAPLLMAGHLAACTQRIRLGMAVSILPFQHPLRTAEDAALVDVLSGGRLNLGIGRGYSAIEYGGFGIDMDESRERFQECLDIIKLAWTSTGYFSYEGKHYQVPAVATNPRPLQQPHPPIWVAATSPSTIGWAAEQGYPYLTDHMVPWEGLGHGRQAYRSALEARGASQDEMRRLLAKSAVLRMVYVAEDDREAVRDPEPHLQWYQEALIRYGSSAREGRYSSAYEFQKQMNQQQQSRDYAWYLENSVLFGSPARIVDRLQRLREEAGIEQVICWVSFGGMEREKARRSLHLFAERVMPHLG